MAEYTQICDVCNKRGSSWDSELWYNKPDFEESFISLIKKSHVVPKEVEDICCECYHAIKDDKNFFEDFLEVEERLKSGL